MSLRLGLTRWLFAAVVVANAPQLAWAVCTVTTCNDGLTKLVNNPLCCGAQSCTLDGTITLSGPLCALDFGSRDVTLTGTLVLGSSTLDLRARSLTTMGAGLVNGRGASGSPGGTLAVTTTTGALTMAGAIDLSGFGRGGGTFTADVGGGVSVSSSGAIHADARDSFGSGGTILITTRSGGMTVAGPVTADGVGDGIGGTIALDATAGALILGENATVSADGDGGAIAIDTSGTVTVERSARVSATGRSQSGASGGAIDVTADTVVLKGTLEASGGSDPSGDIGGDGGAITIETQRGPLLVSRTGTAAITVQGAAGGSGGEVSLTTGSPGNGTLSVDGLILAKGQGGSQNRPGGGGIVELISASSLFVSKKIDVSGTGEASGELDVEAGRDVSVTAVIAGDDPYGGGILDIAAGHDLTIGADLDMNATPGSDGPGGEINLAAGNDLAVEANVVLEASGSSAEPGGSINASAGRHLTIAHGAELKANGGPVPGGPGGQIDLEAGFSSTGGRQTGNLVIDGDINANGKNSNSSASILLGGCEVTIGSGSIIDSTGTAPSTNFVVGRTRITVNGKLRAQTANLANHRIGTPPVGSGQVTPAFALTPQPACTSLPAVNCLVPCPACNDGIKQFPEDCDPVGCGAGCDIHCRTLLCIDPNTCTNDTCDPVFGCVYEPKPEATPCNDNNPCTTGDACAGQFCLSRTPANCNDNNVCTTDSCSPPGGCVHAPVNCNDNNVCTQTDNCVPATGCVNTNLVVCPAGKVCDALQGCIEKPCSGSGECDDENPCTEDTCVANRCQSNAVPRNGAACPDSDVCNGSETCSNGACLPGTPLNCTDTDACTAPDTCDAVLGCQNDRVPGCCNQKSDCPGSTVCTTCVDHQCGTAENCCVADTDCNDENPCTTDGACNQGSHSCPPHVPVTDGRDCGDVCQPATCNNQGTCVPGTPLACPDDGNPCTNDFCDPTSGCASAPIEDCCRDDTAGVCGDICTFCDVDALRCSTTPGCVACTLDTDCDPLGRCTGAACGPDGKCTTVEPTNCDDGVAGTRDVCAVDGNGAPVCQHQCLTAAVCNDNNACNGVETCNAGTCVAGAPLDCNDGNACTIDTCDPARGCVPTDEQDFGAVRCELDNIAAALAAASSTDVAAPVRSKLDRLLGKARTKLDAAEAAGPGKKAQKALAVVKAQAKMIRQVVKTAVKKRKMAAGLGQVILGASDGASRAAQTLRSRLRT